MYPVPDNMFREFASKKIFWLFASKKIFQVSAPQSMPQVGGLQSALLRRGARQLVVVRKACANNQSIFFGAHTQMG